MGENMKNFLDTNTRERREKLGEQFDRFHWTPYTWPCGCLVHVYKPKDVPGTKGRLLILSTCRLPDHNIGNLCQDCKERDYGDDFLDFLEHDCSDPKKKPLKEAN